jgi:ankyrin repeat protein
VAALINAVDNNGNTALLTASALNHLATAQVLLQPGKADVAIANNRNRTALHEAAAGGRHGSIQTLSPALMS